eukprot:9936901-Alexandrium_andersonii.AAC.1
MKTASWPARHTSISEARAANQIDYACSRVWLLTSLWTTKLISNNGHGIRQCDTHSRHPCADWPLSCLAQGRFGIRAGPISKTAKITLVRMESLKFWQSSQHRPLGRA